MGVCDVPVISSVCDAVGEGAASRWRPVRLARPGDGCRRRVAVRGGLVGVRHHHAGGCHQARLRRRLQPAVRHRGLRDADLLLPPTHHRPDPPRPHRADPRRARTRQVGIGIVRGHHAHRAASLEVVDQLCIGIVQAAGETTESMGEKIALLAAGLVGINIAAPGVGAIITIFMAGLAITAAAIVWLSLLVREGVAPGGGGVRSARVQRRILGCQPGVDRGSGRCSSSL